MFEAQSPPLSDQEWGTAGGTSSGRWARDPDSRYDQYFGAPRQLSMQSSPVDDRLARPSIGRRMVRAATRFGVAVLIGVGATLAWQSYGDTAAEMMVARLPALAWVLPASTMKSQAQAAMSSNPAQQLDPMASTLDAVRRSVEQLAAKQDQLAQSIAVLRAMQEEVREKTSSALASPVEQTVPNPQPRPQPQRTQPVAIPHAPAAGSLPR